VAARGDGGGDQRLSDLGLGARHPARRRGPRHSGGWWPDPHSQTVSLTSHGPQDPITKSQGRMFQRSSRAAPKPPPVPSEDQGVEHMAFRNTAGLPMAAGVAGLATLFLLSESAAVTAAEVQAADGPTRTIIARVDQQRVPPAKVAEEPHRM